jgi:hypothetical protein
MRPSASKIDPPFRVEEIRNDPGLWSRREARLKEAWPRERSWTEERGRCPHRA